MGKTCAVVGCKRVKDGGKEATLHKFPRNPTLREKWCIATKREGFQATEDSRICSDHFSSHDFESSTSHGKKGLQRRRIRGDAVPRSLRGDPKEQLFPPACPADGARQGEVHPEVQGGSGQKILCENPAQNLSQKGGQIRDFFRSVMFAKIG